MVRALGGIPGATFATWFRVNSRAAGGDAVALIAAGTSGITRDRLFFIHEDAATEIILGCPKCRKELFRIGAKKCHNCGLMLVPASDKSLRRDRITLLSSAASVAGLVALLPGSHPTVSAVSFFLSMLGLVAGVLTLDANKVKLLYRLDPDRAFIQGRVLKLDSKAYSSSDAPKSIARAIADELVQFRNAQLARREREARPKGSSSRQHTPCLSDAFSLGKQDWQ